jgi:signal peptidase I
MTDTDGSQMANAYPIAEVLRGYVNGNQVARLTVSSNSMAPLLKIDDVIGLQKIDKTRVKPGQIITFEDAGDTKGLITHRLITHLEDGQGHLLMLTRGDHALLFDQPWNADALVGQVMWRVRNRRLLRFDKGPGQWLSNQMGLMAERERARISGLPLADLHLTSQGIAGANDRARHRRKKLFSRLVHMNGRIGRESLALISPLFTFQEDDFKETEIV